MTDAEYRKDPTPTEDLVAALAEMSDPKKTGTTVGARTYSYLTLPDLLKMARTTLGRHRIALMQHGVALPAGGVSVTTTLLHSSGHTWVTDPLELPSQRDPQSVGSVFTYARRYQLAALLGLSGSDDDDATPVEKPQTKTVRVQNRTASAGTSQPPPTGRVPAEDARAQVIAIHARLSQLEKLQGRRYDREERHQIVAGLLGLDILHSLNDLDSEQRRNVYALLTALTQQDATPTGNGEPNGGGGEPATHDEG